MNDQIAIPCVVMRGGTSRGPFFLASDLPADPRARDAVLLSVMGGGHDLGIDGIGGGNAVINKVAIIGPASVLGADVDYLFAQVRVREGIVDTSPNCGNMLAAVGPFAIEAGLVAGAADRTQVRIHNVNTGKLIDATVSTPGGKVTYEGEARIDGVPGTAAKAVRICQKLALPVGLRVCGSSTERCVPAAGSMRATRVGAAPVEGLDDEPEPAGAPEDGAPPLAVPLPLPMPVPDPVPAVPPALPPEGAPPPGADASLLPSEAEAPRPLLPTLAAAPTPVLPTLAPAPTLVPDEPADASALAAAAIRKPHLAQYHITSSSIVLTSTVSTHKTCSVASA